MNFKTASVSIPHTCLGFKILPNIKKMTFEKDYEQYEFSQQSPSFYDCRKMRYTRISFFLSLFQHLEMFLQFCENNSLSTLYQYSISGLTATS